MRKMILAPALVLALSANVFAEGDMQFGLTGPPKNPHATCDPVGAHAGGSLTSQEADTLSETLLNLIDSVLALF